MSFICYLLLFHFQEMFQCNDAKNVVVNQVKITYLIYIY